MRYFIILLLTLFFSISQAQEYTIEADTTICRCTITQADGQARWMFLIDEIRYIDKNGPEIEIFDDRMSFHDRNSRIVNFVSLAALKVAIDGWIASCR